MLSSISHAFQLAINVVSSTIRKVTHSMITFVSHFINKYPFLRIQPVNSRILLGELLQTPRTQRKKPTNSSTLRRTDINQNQMRHQISWTMWGVGLPIEFPDLVLEGYDLFGSPANAKRDQSVHLAEISLPKWP